MSTHPAPSIKDLSHDLLDEIMEQMDYWESGRDSLRPLLQRSDEDRRRTALRHAVATKVMYGLLVAIGRKRDVPGFLTGQALQARINLDVGKLRRALDIPELTSLTGNVATKIAAHLDENFEKVTVRACHLIDQTVEHLLAEWPDDLGLSCAPDPAHLMKSVDDPVECQRIKLETRRMAHGSPASSPAPAITAGASTEPSAEALATIESLRRLLAESEQRANSARAAAQSAKDEVEALKAAQAESVVSHLSESNRSLRARLRAIEAGFEQSVRNGHLEAAITIPTSWDSLEQFADQHLAGRVVLSARAIKAARDSHYADISHAYRVLLMLAQDYVPMRRGEPGARERFERSCRQLGVDIGLTGQAAEDRRYAAEYKLSYMGTQHTLDMHVRGSSARDLRLQFRVYFTWVDQDDGYVLVGSLPHHLDSRARR